MELTLYDTKISLLNLLSRLAVISLNLFIL